MPDIISLFKNYPTCKKQVVGNCTRYSCLYTGEQISLDPNNVILESDYIFYKYFLRSRNFNIDLYIKFYLFSRLRETEKSVRGFNIKTIDGRLEYLNIKFSRTYVDRFFNIYLNDGVFYIDFFHINFETLEINKNNYMKIGNVLSSLRWELI